MFAKSHAFIQSTSGCYVKWVWGVFGPQSPSPLSLMKSPARKTFISLPVLIFIKRGLSRVSPPVHVFLKDAKNVEMWTWRCSFVLRVSNKLLVKRDFNWTHGGATLFRANNKTFEFTWEHISCMIWTYSNKLTIPNNNKVTTKQLIADFLFFFMLFLWSW